MINLEGNNHDDILDGGAGRDTLNGGEGMDTYLLTSGEMESDEILDADGNVVVQAVAMKCLKTPAWKPCFFARLFSSIWVYHLQDAFAAECMGPAWTQH